MEDRSVGGNVRPRLRVPIVVLALVMVGLAVVTGDAGTTLDLEPETQHYELWTNRTATAQWTLRNLVATSQNFTLTLTGFDLPGWRRSSLPQEVTVTPGGVRVLNVTVSVAENATRAYATLTLTAYNRALSQDFDQVTASFRFQPPGASGNVSATPSSPTTASPPASGTTAPAGAPTGGTPAPPTADGSQDEGGNLTVFDGSDGASDWQAAFARSLLWLRHSSPYLGAGAAAWAWTLEPVRFRVTALLASLFSRLHRHRVLDHAGRSRILEAVSTDPGIPYADLRRLLRMPNGVLTHHLDVLVRQEFLVARREGRRKRFYPPGRPNPTAPLLGPAARSVAAAVAAFPGMRPRDLARHLGLSKQVVSYHLARLSAAHIVRLERSGRRARCFPSSARPG